MLPPRGCLLFINTSERKFLKHGHTERCTFCTLKCLLFAVLWPCWIVTFARSEAHSCSFTQVFSRRDETSGSLSVAVRNRLVFYHMVLGGWFHLSCFFVWGDFIHIPRFLCCSLLCDKLRHVTAANACEDKPNSYHHPSSDFATSKERATYLTCQLRK